MKRPSHMLNAHQVGIWCKRAAWIIVAFNIVLLLLQVYQLLIQRPSASSLPLWASILSYLLSYGGTAILDFSLLYAAGVLIGHVVRTREKSTEGVEDDESTIKIQR